jgi:hypothetical protein
MPSDPGELIESPSPTACSAMLRKSPMHSIYTLVVRFMILQFSST